MDDLVKKTKFFVAASKVWKELGFDKKLDAFYEKLGSRELDPFDPEKNPFFIVEQMFRDELVSRKIIERNRDDLVLTSAFLFTKYSARLTSKKQELSEEAGCDGDCTHCPEGVDISEHEEVPSIDNSNKSWN